MQSIHQYLYNDFTNIYKLENEQQRTTSPYEINQAIEKKTKGIYFFLHPYLSFGDYDKSCEVERSNLRIFLEEYENNPDIQHIKGSYGSEAIAIDINCSDASIIELLESLDSYPALDDEDVSNMKIQMEEEAWDACIKSDFISALEKKFDADYSIWENDALWQLYTQLKKKTNNYAEVQAGGNVYIDIEKLVEQLETIPIAA